MRERRSVPRSPLTSLVDVLFILLFATLVQQRSSVEAAVEPDPAPPTVVQTMDAGVPAPAPEDSPDPHQSARAIAQQLETDTVVLVAIDGTGTITSIETQGEVTTTDLPLLRATIDQRVVVYAATAAPELRLCKQVASALGADLAGALILIGTSGELRALPYALVRGLRDDTSRCPDDTGAYALMVRATALRSQPATNP